MNDDSLKNYFFLEPFYKVNDVVIITINGYAD